MQASVRTLKAPQIIPCHACPLRVMPVFRPFEKTELEFVSKFKRGELSVDKGSSVLVEGSHSAHLFTCLSGWGFRFKLLDDGRRQILNYVLPGDLIGLQGVLMGEMQHSVDALTEMRLCVFERDKLNELYSNHPGLGFDMTWIASREEQMLDENLLSIGRRTAIERAAYLLAFLHARAQSVACRRPGWGGVADPPAACRGHTGPVAGAHQQDIAQTQRPQAHHLGRDRLQGAATGAAGRAGALGRLGGTPAAAWCSRWRHDGA